MTPEEAVIARLAGVGAVTALVSTRIYQLRVPQSPTYPFVRVQHISELAAFHLRGGLALKRTRVQVDMVAHETSGVDPLASAAAVAAAVEGDGGNGADVSGLSGFSGTVGTLRVAGVFKVGSGQDYEAGELRLVRIRHDYHVWWRPLTA